MPEDMFEEQLLMKQGINFMPTARASDPSILGITQTRDTPPQDFLVDDADLVSDSAGLSEGSRPFACNYDDSEVAGEPPYWATWGF